MIRVKPVPKSGQHSAEIAHNSCDTMLLHVLPVVTVSNVVTTDGHFLLPLVTVYQTDI